MTGFPPQPPIRVRIGEEIVEVTAKAGGAERMVAAAQPAGEVVSLIRWADRLQAESVWFYERYPGPIDGEVTRGLRPTAYGWR